MSRGIVIYERGESAMGNEFFRSQSDVAGDLAQQRRSDVATFVQRDSRSAAVSMAILDVRAALAHGDKPEALNNAANFGRFKNGKRAHVQAIATF
jgi:hypothetical protein